MPPAYAPGFDGAPRSAAADRRPANHRAKYCRRELQKRASNLLTQSWLSAELTLTSATVPQASILGEPTALDATCRALRLHPQRTDIILEASHDTVELTVRPRGPHDVDSVV